jgi:hypothetical protein
MVPMTKLLNVQFVGVDLMTGLPEYRNGGLLVDTGLLTLKAEDTARGIAQYHDNAEKTGAVKVEVVPLFTPDDDVVVEWRAITVGFLDDIHKRVNADLKLNGSDRLSLPQVLEAGTWKVRLNTETCSVTRRSDHADVVLLPLGRPRNRRGLATKHERATNHDPVRWYGLLGLPCSTISLLRSPLCRLSFVEVANYLWTYYCSTDLANV